MTAALDIVITKAETSKLNDLNLENIPFGKYFTDHMLEATFENGEWSTVEIKPYQPLVCDPSTAVFHYGQAIFEGIKAYKNAAGEASIFRPYNNLKRFNISAERMCMPAVPEEIFIDGMRKLIEMDSNWIPAKKEHSLYIRPFMIGIDAVLGVKPCETYKFMIILSPTGPYYAEPMKIYIEDTYTRAAPGGVGFSKNAGNYGGSMKAALEAKILGYDQVLWTDAFEHKWLQEVGMMNVIFIINDTAVTPSLEEGTILEGVTRSSAITILKEMGLKVEERRINIDELVAAYQSGELKEAFGVGTAATVAPIKEFGSSNIKMELNVANAVVAKEIKRQLDAIRYSEVADRHNWLFKI